MRKKSGLTLVEILTVLAIIALLTGILIPAVSAVKNAAKEVKQKGQLSTIELALTAFKNDYGDYPSSGWEAPPSRPGTGGIYCGPQRLSEALLGLDLLGFHPASAWWWDGLDATGTIDVYGSTTGDLSARKGPYLESGTEYAFKPSDLFASHPLAGQPGMDRYILCDVFGATKVPLPDGSVAKAGAPILYYRANPSGNTIDTIYDAGDNLIIIQVKEAVDGVTNPFNANAFYEYIRDPKIAAKDWPYNPGSYILISAGADGTYGTSDDIRNFGN